MKLPLIILLYLTLNCFSDYQSRVVLYLMDNGETEEQSWTDTGKRGRVVITSDKNGTSITSWSIPDITEPTESELPTEEATGVLDVPEKDRKYVDGHWVKKTTEEIQNDKSTNLKKSENKIMDIFYADGVIPPEQQHIEQADWDAMWVYLEDLPDNKFLKLDKEINYLEKKGGNVNDVYWHDDV